jgi:streptogramin lyase
MESSISEWVHGKIYRFAGIGTAGYSGDGKAADEALLNGPAGLAIDNSNNIYVAELHNNVIRKINTKTKIITTVAGCGLKGFSGDGGSALSAKLNGPEGVFVDSDNNIFIADTFNHRIRRVDGKSGIISTIAGTGEAGYNQDNVDAVLSKLNFPSGVISDSKGKIYFNDYKNDRIRKIDINGEISTFAGTGVPGYSGPDD